MSDLPTWMQAGGSAVAVVVVLILLPGIAVTAGMVAWAWWYGWEPSRFRNLVLAIAAATLVGGVFTGDMLWPWTTAVAAYGFAQQGLFVQAIVNAAGAELLISACAAWWLWHSRTHVMRSGTQQIAGERHEKGQRKRRAAGARRRSKQELTPLSRDERVILGHRADEVHADVELASEMLTRRHKPWIEILVERIKLHLAVIGETGAGKTTLLYRLAAGWTESAWRTYDLRSSQVLSGSNAGMTDAAVPRPLTIFVEAKGGREAGAAAREWADTMEVLGIQGDRVGIFPFSDRLNLWSLPPKQMLASLHALAGTDHRFWDTLQRGLLHLVIDAPDGPPKSSVEFLQRINEVTLRKLWEGWTTEQQTLDALTAGSKGQASALQNDLLLFADLFRSLGGDFDSGRPLADFDALYVSLPGTTDRTVAQAKAAVLIEMLTYELSTEPREVLFVLDEFSAVSGETADAVINLVERLRSMGGSVIVSSQSYQGLAPTDDERERLLNATGGGMLVMRTQGAEPLAKRSGTRKVSEVGRKLTGPGSTELDNEGTVRRQDAFLLDPNRVRKMPAYHVAYVLPEEVQYGLVTPLPGVKRLPSRVLLSSPQRALPTSGNAIPLAQLRADQDKETRGWSL